MTDRAALTAALTGVMEREGGRLAEWHSWRCEYPDRYLPCNCNHEVAEVMLDAVLLLIAEGIKQYAIEEFRSNEWRYVASELEVLVRSYLQDQP